MSTLPFFAPFRVGHFEVHGVPISDDAVMVWAYDMTSDGIGWDGVADVKFEYTSRTRRKRARLAWQLRREMVDSLGGGIECAAGGEACVGCTSSAKCLALEDAKEFNT